MARSNPQLPLSKSRVQSPLQSKTATTGLPGALARPQSLAKSSLCSHQSSPPTLYQSTQLKKFPILRPSLDQQREVLNVFGAIDALLNLDREDLAKLRLLKHGLAQSLLSGEVDTRS